MTFLKIKIRGIKIDVAKIVPKKTFFLSLVNIFFSVNGIKKIPSKIKKGNFTDSQIGIYVGVNLLHTCRCQEYLYKHRYKTYPFLELL